MTAPTHFLLQAMVWWKWMLKGKSFSLLNEVLAYRMNLFMLFILPVMDHYGWGLTMEFQGWKLHHPSPNLLFSQGSPLPHSLLQDLKGLCIWERQMV